MSLYETISRRIEAHEWLGPEFKDQFPEKFNPEMVTVTKSNGNAYGIVHFQSLVEFQSVKGHSQEMLKPGDFIIKLSENMYKILDRKYFLSKYRPVENS